MNNTTVKIHPSGLITVFEDPLGLSKDENSTKALKSATTREMKEHWALTANPPPVGPSCMRQDRKLWIPGKLTPYARHQIIESCCLIDLMFNRRNTCFFTGTLPRFAPEVMREIDEHWDSIVDLWVKKTRYHLGKGGVKEWIVHKTEWQADGTLHLHAVYPGRLPGRRRWLIDKELARKLWRETVLNFVPGVQGNDFAAATRVEVVRRSAARYMSKYMTKASCNTVLSSPTSVKRCWGSTRPLKTALREFTSGDSWQTSRPLIYALEDALASSNIPAHLSPLVTLPSGCHWLGATVPKSLISQAKEMLEDSIQKEQNSQDFGYIPPALTGLEDGVLRTQTSPVGPINTPLSLDELPF